MVWNNSAIKYVLSWTSVCKVSGQEQILFQTNQPTNTKPKQKTQTSQKTLSNHLNN